MSLNPKKGVKPILAAVSVEVFDYLVSKGADPWSRWPEGDLMIYNVAMQGSSDLLQKLIDLKMEINSFNHKGFTPLMIAANFNRLDHVKILINAGADPTLKDQNGKTALDYAKEQGYQEVVDYLEKLKKNNTAPSPASSTSTPTTSAPRLW